jgi:hypothetical protein
MKILSALLQFRTRKKMAFQPTPSFGEWRAIACVLSMIPLSSAANAESWRLCVAKVIDVKSAIPEQLL